eukprot:scaffold12.g8116.t1
MEQTWLEFQAGLAGAGSQWERQAERGAAGFERLSAEVQAAMQSGLRQSSAAAAEAAPADAAAAPDAGAAAAVVAELEEALESGHLAGSTQLVAEVEAAVVVEEAPAPAKGKAARAVESATQWAQKMWSRRIQSAKAPATEDGEQAAEATAAAERSRAAKAAAEAEERAQEEQRRQEAAAADAAWRAEQERAAKEQAEKERAAKEQAEKERAAKEQAEKERAAKEHAEKERAAKEQAEKERAAKEQAEKERAAKEQAEKERAEKERQEAEAAAAAAAAEAAKQEAAAAAAKAAAAAEAAAAEVAAAAAATAEAAAAASAPAPAEGEAVTARGDKGVRDDLQGGRHISFLSAPFAFGRSGGAAAAAGGSDVGAATSGGDAPSTGGGDDGGDSSGGSGGSGGGGDDDAGSGGPGSFSPLHLLMAAIGIILAYLAATNSEPLPTLRAKIAEWRGARQARHPCPISFPIEHYSSMHVLRRLGVRAGLQAGRRVPSAAAGRRPAHQQAGADKAGGGASKGPAVEVAEEAGSWAKDLLKSKAGVVATGLSGLLLLNLSASYLFDLYYKRSILDALLHGVAPPPEAWPPALRRADLRARLTTLLQARAPATARTLASERSVLAPSRFYHVVFGLPGTGKSTVVRQAVDWGAQLGERFGFRYEEHLNLINVLTTALFGSEVKKKSAEHELASLRRAGEAWAAAVQTPPAPEALHSAAVEFQRRTGRAYVLVIDSSDRMAASKDGRMLLRAMLEYARDWASEGTIKVVWVAHSWATVELLEGSHPTRSRASAPVLVGNISEEEGLEYLAHLGAEGSVARRCSALAGGSLLLLERCAAAAAAGEDAACRLLDLMEMAYAQAGLLDATPQQDAGLSVVEALLRSKDHAINAAEWRERVPNHEHQLALLEAGIFAFDGRTLRFASRLAANYATRRLKTRLARSEQRKHGGLPTPPRQAWG